MAPEVIQAVERADRRKDTERGESREEDLVVLDWKKVYIIYLGTYIHNMHSQPLPLSAGKGEEKLSHFPKPRFHFFLDKVINHVSRHQQGHVCPVKSLCPSYSTIPLRVAIKGEHVCLHWGLLAYGRHGGCETGIYLYKVRAHPARGWGQNA